MQTERGFFRLGPHTQYLRDPGGGLELADVLARSGDFQSLSGAYPAFGITPDAIWLRFTVQPEPAAVQAWHLEFANSVLSDLRIYRADRAPILLSTRTPILERPYAHHNFVIPLGEIAASETIYIRVRSNAALNLPLFLWTAASFPMWDMLRTFGFGLFFGLMLVMALYNFFLYLSIRDRAYLYYVLYIFAISAFFSAVSGHLVYLLSNDRLHWLEILAPPMSMVAAGFALQFSRSFLLVRSQLPWASRLIDVVLAIHIAAIVLMGFLGPLAVVTLANTLPLLSIGTLLGCAILLARRGFRPAKYFLIAWATLIAGAFLFVAQNLGLIPSGFTTQYSLFIGAGLEAVLLSLALGYRINLLKEADARSRRLLVEEQAAALERERTMSASFARFVPEEFLRFLGKDSIIQIERGDVVRKNMAVLFLDIRGFTTLSENLGPEETFAFLNEFHGLLEPLIERHGGFIDKFIGDAIMALFPEPAGGARAAVAMQQAVASAAIRAVHRPRIGVGLHSGDVMLGTVGSPRRLETTVIGDTVNVASRIEGVNKAYGSEVVVSDAVYKSIRDDSDFQARELDAIRVRGKKKPIVLYEFLNTLPEQVRDERLARLPEYMTALLAYRAGDFAESRAAFESYLRALEFGDGAAAVYLKRLERLIAQAPNDWDGVWSGS